MHSTALERIGVAPPGAGQSLRLGCSTTVGMEPRRTAAAEHRSRHSHSDASNPNLVKVEAEKLCEGGIGLHR